MTHQLLNGRPKVRQLSGPLIGTAAGLGGGEAAHMFDTMLDVWTHKLTTHTYKLTDSYWLLHARPADEGFVAPVEGHIESGWVVSSHRQRGVCRAHQAATAAGTTAAVQAVSVRKQAADRKPRCRSD